MNRSYKGKILISTPDVSGDIFSRSVVLIINHDEEGAFGLILNKKNPVLSHHFQKSLSPKIEVYSGGPVGTTQMFFIIKGNEPTLDAEKITEGYTFTENASKVIGAIMMGTIAPEDIKIFYGYSGWRAMQLDTEIENKYWISVENYEVDLTASFSHTLWKNIMENLGGLHLIWANTPEDVSLN
ncbi:YqgE/AlgH family protein [Riemerella anatipestifer]|uniref:YqgE/AlgH family protein n=1 Tax=Riemerella anatipestifer TaxID=34085 RepID=UPI0021D58B12|nr:YqgE/AlgH family protein [Riemerella anatipestifer]MCU7573921.1 YqgE/AlgH family protein [Riemerella anatipestifer]MCU7595081.1 YqgE/AlgH family protein [Riemerella anatipestifer]MDR7819358.1 YqgE/AlgH family protein [Riemerella anatipestifer]MDR7876152.1 YqgE/AlgH family protein [Riemerella anatipestifer]MDW3553957.1 YqgE/AlgH family protein [Riemerella anatipestifer]